MNSMKIMNFSRVARRWCPMSIVSKRNASSFQDQNLDRIREDFRKLSGGQVTLTRLEADGLALICIDHPEKKNSFSGKMMVDLSEVVSRLETWKTGKGVIVYGKGDAFCSGGYLKTVREIANSRDGLKMAKLMHDSLVRLRSLPLVSVSLIHGKALGGGAELILGTDFRLMSSSAEVSYVEAKMGVGTGWGGSYFLTQQIGRTNALDLLLTCRKVNSEDAMELGLVNGLIPPEMDTSEDARLNYAIDWMKDRTQAHASSVVQTVKNIVNCENLEREREYFSESWGGPEQLKALNKNTKHK